MPNPHGTPIWYELLTADPAAAKAFYDQVFGWTIEAESTMPGMDYRMIAAGNDNAPGDFVGGVAALTPEMTAGGAKPAWLFYIGVDDVDATVAKLQSAGGSVLMPAWDIPNVGRMAFVADPQGIPFYVMRGASDDASTVFDTTAIGKCCWNELTTSDQAAANAFYADLFGWSYPDKMSMPVLSDAAGGVEGGDMGDYVFVQAGDTTIGATMNQPPGSPPPAWQFYFRVPDIDAAVERVKAAGGTVHYGPAEVPGGDRIIVAGDPQGVMFGAVGPA